MPLIDNETRGVFVIAVTPFSENGAIDFDSLDRAVDFYFEAGADGLTILGMMGEAPKVTQAESIEVARRVIERAGDRPVVVGVSSPGLAAIGELTRSVMDLGAGGVMVAPPSSLKTDDQIVAYYGLVAETVGGDVPLVLQDFPLATNVTISAGALNRIVATVPSVSILKHEDWPGLAKISALRAAEAGGQRRLSILCGNGGLFLPEEIARGADGAMTGFGFPEMMVAVVRHASTGEMARARDIFDAYLPLLRYEQQPGLGLAVRKYVLCRRGIIASETLRRPGQALTADTIAEVDVLMARQETRLKELG